MGIFKKKFLLFTLLLSSALTNGWADEDNEHDSVSEEEPATPYEWEYFPLEYHPSVTEFQKNLGLLDKFPNIDA